MMGIGVATPYHCGNGFFLHGQFTAAFPKQTTNATLANTRD
jgi:hypothetical protein